MSNIKLVAVDLDGTILDAQHRLSGYSKKVIQKLQAQGIVFVPVTGRPLPAMQTALPSNLCDYSINTNGVHVFKHNESQTVRILNNSMPWCDAKEVFDYAERYYPQVLVQAYVDNSLHTTKQDYRTEEYTRRSGLHYTILNDWKEIEGNTISKIMMLDKHDTLAPVEERFTTWKKIQAVFSMPNYLEIFNIESSKGNALKYLAESLNISMVEVLGVGDSYNDLPMLDVCGISYVMKNANKNIAPSLPRTEFSNNEDGAAKLIEALVPLA